MEPLVLAAALLSPQILEAALPAEFEVVGLPASAPADVPRTYPQRRWYAQSQAWWRPKTGDTSHHGEGQHIHVETAFPFFQEVSGIMLLDVRIQLHAQPAGNILNKFRIKSEDGTDVLVDASGNTIGDIPLAIKPDANGNADVWLKDLRLDTRKVKNGRREFRLTANMTKRTDGKRQYQSTGWLCYVNNAGAAVSNYRSDRWTEARGWFTDANYANARFADLFPFDPVPAGWSPYVELVPGSSGKPITAHMATIDPDFHNGNAGTILKQGAGPYKGRVTIPAGLTAGLHRLVLIAHADITTGRNSGVLVLPIVVK